MLYLVVDSAKANTISGFDECVVAVVENRSMADVIATEKDSYVVYELAATEPPDTEVLVSDPTRFVERSFTVLWNEGHSVRLIDRNDARRAISIPWADIDALVKLLQTRGGVALPPHKKE